MIDRVGGYIFRDSLSMNLMNIEGTYSAPVYRSQVIW